MSSKVGNILSTRSMNDISSFFVSFVNKYITVLFSNLKNSGLLSLLSLISTILSVVLSRASRYV